MQFSVSSNALYKRLAAIQSIIPTNPVVPILHSFLFEVKDKQLTVTASDLHTYVTVTLPIESKGNTSMAIPARILLETLKTLPDQSLTFTLTPKTYNVTIDTLNGSYKLTGENPTDFPPPPSREAATQCQIPSATLEKVIQQTVFAIADSSLRPAMGGLHMNTHADGTTFVATDGHRLVRVQLAKVVASKAAALTIPTKPLKLLKGLLIKTKEDIAMHIAKEYAYFALPGMQIFTRLISEVFPDYVNVIPKGNPYTLQLERHDLLSALRRTDLYASKASHYVRLELQSERIQLLAEDLEFANKATEVLKGDYQGEPMAIGFNAKQLIEVLDAFKTEHITLRLESPTKTVIVHPSQQADNEDVMALLMPLTLQQ